MMRDWHNFYQAAIVVFFLFGILVGTCFTYVMMSP